MNGPCSSILRSRQRSLRSVRDREAGTGVVSSMLGALAFLGFLLLAVHVVVGLYATSVLRSCAWDAARLAAVHTSSASQEPDVAPAERQLLERLHGFRHVTVTWSSDDHGGIGLTVAADRPALLPAGLLPSAPLRRLESTAWVRDEVLQ